MDYLLLRKDADEICQALKSEYRIFAPKLYAGEGCFSETDVIRYGEIDTLAEIVFDRKSDYSFKEVLLNISQTLFYYAGKQTVVPEDEEKGAIIFLRSCDLHAVKRLDQIYLNNGPEDFYYKRLREKAKFVLMGCEQSFEGCFCVSMGTNRTEDYDAYLKVEGEQVLFDSKWDALTRLLESKRVAGETVTPDHAAKQDNNAAVIPDHAAKQDTGAAVVPDYVTENECKVTLPKNLTTDCYSWDIWTEYGSRCIGCGRCNFVCPTCTCFTMQDVQYKENAGAGERRRVAASCQVDGYTDMAGGISFRKTQGERLRYKVMHKVQNFKNRFGYTMCVGCGRCEAVCPEYISYTALLNHLAKKEGQEHE